MSTSELCDALVKAMKEISFDGLTGNAMTWNANGAVDKLPTAVVIKDGKYVSATNVEEGAENTTDTEENTEDTAA